MSFGRRSTVPVQDGRSFAALRMTRLRHATFPGPPVSNRHADGLPQTTARARPSVRLPPQGSAVCGRLRLDRSALRQRKRGIALVRRLAADPLAHRRTLKRVSHRDAPKRKERCLPASFTGVVCRRPLHAPFESAVYALKSPFPKPRQRVVLGSDSGRHGSGRNQLSPIRIDAKVEPLEPVCSEEHHVALLGEHNDCRRRSTTGVQESKTDFSL